MNDTKKIGLWTLVMLIFVPTFGFGNITSNAVYLGPAAIPSWFIVSILYFLPLSIVIAELASANKDKEGGLYAWLECGLGPKWAFIGTWSYFIANLFYLQMVFARIPVMLSWTLLGKNIFTDANAWMLPIISLVLAVALTFIATQGVKFFSKIADWGGKFTLFATVVFIVFAIGGLLKGIPSATAFTAANLMPSFDVSYFSTFSWLLFAVAGAEVAGTYITGVDNPNKTFPKGVLLATLFIAIAYTIGSYAVCLVISPEALEQAGLKDAGYVVYQILAQNWGLNGTVAVQLYAGILTVSSIAAYVVWMESPIRAMFSEVPENTFPAFLTKKREDGTLVNALWVQCAVVLVLIIVPLVGLNSIDSFFKLLFDLSALALVVPYFILGLAYYNYRMKGNQAPFTMLKSKAGATLLFALISILSIAGFFGAGLDYVRGAETQTDAIVAIVKTYGGPIILVILGYALVWLNKTMSSKKS